MVGPGRAMRDSDVAGDRTGLGRGAIGKVEHHLVEVAPPPPFGGVVALDDGVAARVEVLRGVAVRRVVAAADVAAGPAEPQVHPPGTCLQALLAAARAGRHLADRVVMGACFGHGILPYGFATTCAWPASARKACSVATICAPSPTAAATRFTEPDRTSPMANTPGRLVSSGRRPTATSAPARMNRFSSSATPEPDSQSVFGSAPMKRKRWRIDCRTSSPKRRQWTASRAPSFPSSRV